MADNKQLDIELGSEVAKGSYCNLSIITHSPNEFVLDFLKILPGFPKAVVTERIIMTPENAKRLRDALADNIGKYENQFGPIQLGGQRPDGATFNLADLPGFNGGAKS